MNGQFCTPAMYSVFIWSKNQRVHLSYRELRYQIGRTYSPCRRWAVEEYLRVLVFWNSSLMLCALHFITATSRDCGISDCVEAIWNAGSNASVRFFCSCLSDYPGCITSCRPKELLLFHGTSCTSANNYLFIYYVLAPCAAKNSKQNPKESCNS